MMQSRMILYSLFTTQPISLLIVLLPMHALLILYCIMYCIREKRKATPVGAKLAYAHQGGFQMSQTHCGKVKVWGCSFDCDLHLQKNFGRRGVVKNKGRHVAQHRCDGKVQSMRAGSGAGTHRRSPRKEGWESESANSDSSAAVTILEAGCRDLSLNWSEDDSSTGTRVTRLFWERGSSQGRK